MSMSLKKVVAGVAIAVPLMCGWSQNSHAVPIVDMGTGELLGATSVDVGGTLFDVSFMDGSCIGLFDGCDAVSDFTFNDQAGALAAALALLNQVFLDTPAGNFDSMPQLTRGCTSTATCAVLTPFGFPGPTTLSTSVAQNGFLESIDMATAPFPIDRTFNTSVNFSFTYAKFTLLNGDPGDPGDPASVPEPTTLGVFGIGLVGLGWLRRRQRMAA